MAFKTFLMTVSMVAIASATGFPGWPANENPFPGFHSPMMMSSLRFGPMAYPPSMFGMSTFPQTFPFFQFPAFPTIPNFPQMPSVADIATANPKNKGSFTGVVVSSKMETKRNEDGTIVNEGGSTILTNTDGVVNVKQTGKNPPDLPTNAPPLDLNDPKFDFNDLKIKPSNPYKFKNLKFEDFDDFGFHTAFPDPKMIETYKPSEGETFKGTSFSTHMVSTNINGEVNEQGSATKIDNDNGRVNKENAAYCSDGTQP